MIIRGTEPDFFELIDKKYGGKISFPRKSREEMLEFCKEIFQMKKVPEENNLWRSNSDLLSLCLEIYLGIESTDRIEKTRKYFDYLNCIYEVDFLLENTKISQLNAVELLQQTLNNTEKSIEKKS